MLCGVAALVLARPPRLRRLAAWLRRRPRSPVPTRASDDVSGPDLGGHLPLLLYAFDPRPDVAWPKAGSCVPVRPIPRACNRPPPSARPASQGVAADCSLRQGRGHFAKFWEKRGHQQRDPCSNCSEKRLPWFGETLSCREDAEKLRESSQETTLTTPGTSPLQPLVTYEAPGHTPPVPGLPGAIHG